MGPGKGIFTTGFMLWMSGILYILYIYKLI
jgi:hypothetical protein